MITANGFDLAHGFGVMTVGLAEALSGEETDELLNYVVGKMRTVTENYSNSVQ